MATWLTSCPRKEPGEKPRGAVQERVFSFLLLSPLSSQALLPAPSCACIAARQLREGWAGNRHRALSDGKMSAAAMIPPFVSSISAETLSHLSRHVPGGGSLASSILNASFNSSTSDMRPSLVILFKSNYGSLDDSPYRQRRRAASRIPWLSGHRLCTNSL